MINPNQPNQQEQQLEQYKRMIEARKKQMEEPISIEEYVQGIIQRIEQMLQAKRNQIKKLQLDHSALMLDVQDLQKEKELNVDILRKLKR